jgi:hypothetical protein
VLQGETTALSETLKALSSLSHTHIQHNDLFSEGKLNLLVYCHVKHERALVMLQQYPPSEMREIIK